MTRYRNRFVKATAALWVLVLLADAGWAATSTPSLTTVLVGAVVAAAVVGVVFLVLRMTAREPEPVPVKARRRL